MMSSDATPRDVNLELRQAVYRGDLDAVRLCLDEGGCVTGTFFFPGLARDPFHGLTPDFQMTILTLWRKATNPTIPMLRLLLEHGADASNASDENPLHWACTAGNLEAVRLLLDHGADVDGGRYDQHYTPVVTAATRNNVALLKLLIDRGASLGLATVPSGVYEPIHRRSRTPLGFASAVDRVETVQLLLDRGADINLKDHVQESPLWQALDNGKPRIVRLLLDRGADFERIVFCRQTTYGPKPMAPVSLARTRGCLVLQNYPSRAAHINAVFDLFFLARCVVAGQRAAHRGSERRRVWFDRNLVKVIATFLVVKTPQEGPYS